MSDLTGFENVNELLEDCISILVQKAIAFILHLMEKEKLFIQIITLWSVYS